MKKYFLFLYLISESLFAQAVYLNSTHAVYKFLDKMEAKQFITEYRDEVKPLTRENIAKFLIQMDSLYDTMTDVEHEELAFFKEEFFQELQNLKYDLLLDERWHLYQYQSDPGKFSLDLVGGWDYEKRADGKFTRTTHNGLQVYGYVGNNIGTYFYFHDNREAGSYLDIKRPLTSTPAEVISRDLRGTQSAFEYDDIDAQLTYQFSSVTLSVEKMHNQWGAGERGQLIFSNKAPSFPLIKLRMKLGKDVDFTYFHGWLFSDLLDSVRSFQVSNSYGSLPERIIYKQKYVAAHMLEFTPWNGVDIAFGESEVYGSRNPELLYLIPFMFFKAGEHWMYDNDNSQMFFNIDLNTVKNYNFYLSIFIDEFSTEDFYLTDRQRNQLGFTLGGKSYDLFLTNSSLLVEYTRINPWVYNHKFPDATFQSHSVDMGHWLGQNGDLFYFKFLYQPMRNLKLACEFESLRKGGMLPTQFQYLLPTPDFLYGPLTKYQTLGLSGSYEFVRDLNIDLSILQKRYTSENALLGPDYAVKYDLFFSIRYNVR